MYQDTCEDFDCYVDSFGELGNYNSYESALETVSHLVPDDLFSADNNLTPGDYWASLITVVSGLGIAFVIDMHNKGIEIEPVFITSHLKNVK